MTGSFARCVQCRSLIRRPGIAIDNEPEDELTDKLYFSVHPEYAMTPRTVLSQYLDFVERFRPIFGSTVLDFGCGISDMGIEVQARGGAYVGVERSQKAREILQSRGISAVGEIGDIDRADVILMIEVIEHLEQPGSVLTSLRNRMAADAVVFITTPNASGLRAKVLRNRWSEARNPTHKTLFTRSGLETLLTKHGFERIEWMRSVNFGGIGIRRSLRRGLQVTGLDGGLRVIVRSA